MIDDGRALGQRFGELLGVSSSIFSTNACLVLELVDRRLQLLIEHAPVGHHDNGVKHFLVVLVVQAGQPVCEPSDSEFDLPEPAECWIR